MRTARTRAPRAIGTLLTLALSGIGCAAGATRARPALPATLFFDDFSGDALDRTHWSPRVTGQTFNDEQQAYVDSTSTIYLDRGADAAGAENGALVIQPRYRKGFVTAEGRTFDFISGRIDTRGKLEFTYGTAAARMKLPAGAGLWPAFWILGTGKWPDTGEIDVMESVGDAAWVSAALHGPGYSGDTPLVKRTAFPMGTDATAWHVYAVEWRPDGLSFTIDGRVAYDVSRAMVERYGRWAFDEPKYIILNFALGGTYPSAVNGVRSPYRGLPESTVQSIRANDARILVDWVRVTALDPHRSR